MVRQQIIERFPKRREILNHSEFIERFADELGLNTVSVSMKAGALAGMTGNDVRRLECGLDDQRVHTGRASPVARIQRSRETECRRER